MITDVTVICINNMFTFVNKLNVYMNERIARIISTANLSNKEFAELLGIQRSGVSHLLSGRNKPSLDFLEKLLMHFPDINPRWLILGYGDMRSRKTAQGKPDNKPALPGYKKRIEQPIIEEATKQKVKKDIVPTIPYSTEIDKIIIFKKDGSFEVFQNKEEK